MKNGQKGIQVCIECSNDVMKISHDQYLVEQLPEAKNSEPPIIPPLLYLQVNYTF